jgi:hypothetical protein
MTDTATVADTLQARRAAAAALADQLADQLDEHPRPALRERLHRSSVPSTASTG